MSFNGSGTFNLYATGNPVVTGTTVSASWANNTLSDIASGLSNCITRDGQSPATANIPMGSHKITGLAAGTTAGDSARYEQVTSAVAITGGAIDGTAIGGTTASTGAFTTLSASSTVSGTGFSNYLASPPAIGSTSANTGAFTTLSASSTVTLSGGTANGVAYLNGSNVLTTGSALTFDGTNLGIGTSSPSFGLDIRKPNESVLNLYNTTAVSNDTKEVQISSFNGTYWNYISNNASSFLWKTYNTERMRLDSSGNLLVGTTNNGGRTNSLLCPNWYSSTTAAAANMQVASDGSVNRSTSAIKYKTDVRNLERLDINKLRAVRYKSKCLNDDQTIDYFGLIADEADNAGFKELVTYNEAGEVEGFQYERLTAVLLKELQELKAELDQLKSQIEK